MQYFKITSETTIENLKQQRRDLAKILHPDKPGGDKEHFQDMEQEYAREYIKLSDPATSIFDNQFIQVGLAMADAALKHLGHGTLGEVAFNTGVKFIDKLPSVFDDYKPFIKMFWQGKCETPIESLKELEKAGKELAKKNKPG